MNITTKICGLSTPEAIIAAQENGAEFFGFIFAVGSPRHITPDAASRLASVATAKKVAVVVDADDVLLTQIVENLKPDYIQLHGTESDERALQIKDKFGIPLIRAREPNHKAEVKGLYDYILIDAPGGGGKGVPFDWKNFTAPKGEWFLSGGLKLDNIEEAVKTTAAKMVDVSSGVESAPGIKDLEKIKAFLKKVHGL